jgi:hypothetical protein
MGGKGELVNYTRLHEEGRHRPDHAPEPLTREQKDLLIEKVTHLINSASLAITIAVMIAPTPHHLKEELDKHGGG